MSALPATCACRASLRPIGGPPSPTLDAVLSTLPLREWRNGRRSRLKIDRRKSWGFESPLSHQAASGKLARRPFLLAGHLLPGSIRLRSGQPVYAAKACHSKCDSSSARNAPNCCISRTPSAETCGSTLGYEPIGAKLQAVQADGDSWRPLADTDYAYRFCSNAQHLACNWLIPQENSELFCLGLPP